MFPHGVVRRHAATEGTQCRSLSGSGPLCGEGGLCRVGRGRRGGRGAIAEDLAADGTEGAEGDGRRGAREVSGDALDLLVCFVCGVSADKLVLLEDDDDVWACVDRSYVEASGSDELYVYLALGGGGCGGSIAQV